MKRYIYLTLDLAAAFLATVALGACSLTEQQKQTLELNTLKDAEAAGLTYLTTGSGAAAALAAGAQVIKNHTPVTAAKNPVKVTP